MKGLFLRAQLIRLVVSLVGFFLLPLIICGNALADPPDTLDLDLQWVYPIRAVDIKLVDFDHDGINEILVGFGSDSARVGILDVISESMLWQSPAFDGAIYTVAAGDRNDDGALDIICGGQRSDSGYIEIFDGPDFDSVHALSDFDDKVLSTAISAQCADSLPKIFVGTYRYHIGWDEEGYVLTRTGSLYVLDGKNLIVEEVTAHGAVREMLLYDLDGDGYEELLLGADYLYEEVWFYLPCDSYRMFCRICSDYFGCLYLMDFWYFSGKFVGEYFDIQFEALEVGSFNGGVSNSIIGSGWWSLSPNCKLACWNASTLELEWNMEWKTGTYVTSLNACSFNSQETNAVCVSYRSGLMEFKDALNGNNLAVSALGYSINKVKLGNVDDDNLAEICVVSGDSLYVYETSSITTEVDEIEDYSLPENFCLFQNYPNPFNPETNIRFTIPFASKVTITVYNILGAQVRTFEKYYKAGTHTLIWDGKNSSGGHVASGVYLYKLSAGNYQETKKMVLIR